MLISDVEDDEGVPIYASRWVTDRTIERVMKKAAAAAAAAANDAATADAASSDDNKDYSSLERYVKGAEELNDGDLDELNKNPAARNLLAAASSDDDEMTII